MKCYPSRFWPLQKHRTSAVRSNSNTDLWGRWKMDAKCFAFSDCLLKNLEWKVFCGGWKKNVEDSVLDKFSASQSWLEGSPTDFSHSKRLSCVVSDCSKSVIHINVDSEDITLSLDGNNWVAAGLAVSFMRIVEIVCLDDWWAAWRKSRFELEMNILRRL